MRNARAMAFGFFAHPEFCSANRTRDRSIKTLLVTQTGRCARDCRTRTSSSSQTITCEFN